MLASSKAPTVLVIEDYEPIRDLLEAVLEVQGYCVLCAEDGAMGYEMARRHRPDLITLDLSMPNLDGRGALRCLKSDENTRAIPVVIVSAYGDQLASEDARQVAAVISKPFTLNDLTSVVRGILPATDTL